MSKFNLTIRKQHLLRSMEKEWLFKKPSMYEEMLNRINLEINNNLGGALINMLSDINNSNCVYAIRLSDYCFEDKYDDNNNFIGTLIYREIELKSWREMLWGLSGNEE